jgi:hypothetical protein
MRYLLLMFIVLSGVLVACRGDVDTGDAEEAVRLRLEQDSRGEYAEVWQTLHPTHQAIVSQDKFVECGRETRLQQQRSVETIAILGARQQTKDLPEIGHVEVVTVEVELRNGEDSRRPTYDVVDVDSSWRWVMSDAALRAFAADTCPR